MFSHHMHNFLDNYHQIYTTSIHVVVHAVPDVHVENDKAYSSDSDAVNILGGSLGGLLCLLVIMALVMVTVVLYLGCKLRKRKRLGYSTSGEYMHECNLE